MKRRSVVERWRDVVGYDGAYEVSDFGRVRSNKIWRGKIVGLRPCNPSPYGYPMVSLYKDGRVFMATVSRLVLMAFRGPPPEGKAYACHDDNDPGNCALGNLRWDSNSGNQADREANGTTNIGERNGMSKLTAHDVSVIRRRLASGERQGPIARDYGVHNSAISAIKIGRNWVV